MKCRFVTAIHLCFGIVLLLLPPPARADGMLQLFNVTWADLTRMMPEIAEAGYTSLWLPPPTKGGSGYSAGYDLWDPFDLGDKDQRGTVATRYGTREELLQMVETAHRFGLRVYFDNIMNHRAFDVPRYNDLTPTNLYPGMAPQDFHLRVLPGGYYRNVDHIRDYNNAWQVQNLSLAGLIDIAHENPNANFGAWEGATAPKISFVRHPRNPEYYDFHPTLGRVGFGRVTQAVLDANPAFYTEDVNAYLIRAVRYLVDQTRCDGLRLDAVKHVPAYFFGQQSGADKDSSDAGYVGNIQRQFNLTHGYTDTNHRNSNFDTERVRNDALVFGEHLGEPPGFGEYVDAGMRLLDNPLRNYLNNVLGNPSATLAGLEQRDFGGFSASVRVMHAQSHDNDFAARRELQNALYFIREGVPIIYADGYNKSPAGPGETPFPRHANAAYLGQFGDNKVPDLAWLHQHLARGGTRPRWGDNDIVAFERYDYRESANTADQTVVLFAMNDNYGFPGDISFDDGVAQTTAGTFYECFPVENSRGQGLVVGFPPGSVLAQLADAPGKERACAKLLVRQATNNRAEAEATKNDPNPVNRKVYVGSQTLAPGGGAIEFKIPGGGYVMYGYQWPEASRAAGGRAIVFRQGGVEAPRLIVHRRDGKDGDRGFNPLYPFKVRGSIRPDGSIATGTNVAPFTYAIDVPVITNAPFDIEARVDASAVNVLLKLDGGVDLNSHMSLGPTTGTDRRDNPPGTAYDMFLGFEQARFVHRRGPEKFAARLVSRNTVVSAGAETYHFTVGGSSNVVNGTGGGEFVDTETADWVYHDPLQPATTSGGAATQRFPLAPQAGQSVELWVKVGYEGRINRCHIYYTTDGTNPEGAFGEGYGSTRVVTCQFHGGDQADGTIDWWRGTLPAQPAGTQVRYKIALYKSGISPISDAISDKVCGLTVFAVTNFNPTAALIWLHNNLNPSHTVTGLQEGFHIIRARSFLPRDGKSSVFNTHAQTFYYDAGPPQGVIAFPAANGTVLRGQEYGVVIRTDTITTEVEYNIQDDNPNNDDAVTGQPNGNGLTNGVPIFRPAALVTPSRAVTELYPQWPREFRFNYLAVPSSGQAIITVRLKKLTSGLFPDRVTTLTRTVETLAPPQNLTVAFPARDDETLALDRLNPYTIVARFSDSLPTETNRFTLRIDGAVQPLTRPDGVPLLRFEDQTPGDGQNELRYDWSSMSDGRHVIEVQYSGAALTLSAMRVVNVQLMGVETRIVAPPAFDAQGRPFLLILPAVTNPAPAQRSYQIAIETAPAVTNVLVSFLPTNAPFTGGFAVRDTAFQGDRLRWLFDWTNLVEGTFTIRADALANGMETATREVTVVFRASDADGDGLPDEWERLYTLNELSATDNDGANGDPDADGFTNLEEFLAGTHPRDPQSLLRILASAQGGRQIIWASVPGKTYQVWTTTNAGDPFVLLATNLPAAGATTSFTDTAPAFPRRFYRVRVE